MKRAAMVRQILKRRMKAGYTPEQMRKALGAEFNVWWSDSAITALFRKMPDVKSTRPRSGTGQWTYTLHSG